MHNSQPRPHWRGFSFALHLLRVQGFYFALLQYSPIQAFTAHFVPSVQLYRPRCKTVHRAFQWLFLRLHPLNRLQYQTDTSGYNTTRATLERITAPQHLRRIHQIPPPRLTLYRSAQPPIIIMYIRGGIPQTMQARRGQLLPSVDCWQVLAACQQYRPGAPAEGSASPPVQAKPGGLQSGTGSAVKAHRAAWRPPPGGTVQQQGHGAEPPAAQPLPFSGFRPIANRGQQ